MYVMNVIVVLSINLCTFIFKCNKALARLPSVCLGEGVIYWLQCCPNLQPLKGHSLSFKQPQPVDTDHANDNSQG